MEGLKRLQPLRWLGAALVLSSLNARIIPLYESVKPCLPAIRNILTHLGVWRTFLKDGHIESISIRSAWGSAKPFDSDHIYNPYHSGWHIDRARFDRMLATAASNAGAILFTQVHISNLSHDRPSGWQVVILQDKCSRCLQAPFIIDATGQKSAIPMGLFRSYHVVDHLIGIVRFFTRLAHPYTLVEAEADGWWYSAPLPQATA